MSEEKLGDGEPSSAPPTKCTCPERLYDPGHSEPNDSTCELSEEQHEQLAKSSERQECPQCYSLVRDERHCVYGWHLCKNKWHNELLEAPGDRKIGVGTWVNMGGFVSEIRGNEALVRVDGNCFILALKSIWDPDSGAAQEVSPPSPDEHLKVENK